MCAAHGKHNITPKFDQVRVWSVSDPPFRNRNARLAGAQRISSGEFRTEQNRKSDTETTITQSNPSVGNTNRLFVC